MPMLSTPMLTVFALCSAVTVIAIFRVLTNIIDPNREVPPQYRTHQINLEDGTRLVGSILDQNKQQIRLSLPAGVEHVIERKRVKSLQPLPNSPMPEHLEAGLSHQQMADLLEFLTRSE